MKGLLICPEQKWETPGLSTAAPLSNVSILGKRLLEYWIEHLYSLGAREIQVLAADRPDEVRAAFPDGLRWGVALTILHELKELSREEVIKKYKHEGNWLPAPHDVIVIDHLPGVPMLPLFRSYRDFITTQLAMMHRFSAKDRIGLREVIPGVWIGLHASIAKSARLLSPCWIGDHVFIDHHAVVGPMAIIDNRSVVEAGAEITHSIVGPDTLVGKCALLADSIAHGSTLINWRLESWMQLADPFFVSSLIKENKRAGKARSLLAALRPQALAKLAKLPWLEARRESFPWKFNGKAGA